jgi:hypothetical protein
LALYFTFSSGVGIQFAQSSSQWDARADSEEISQTLLTNRKQGNLDLVNAANFIKYKANENSHLLQEIHFLHYKIIGASINLKNRPSPI